MPDRSQHLRRLKACDETAARTLDSILLKDKALAICRSKLAWVRQTLGKATSAVVYVDTRVRPGQEGNVEPLNRLCQRYSELRRRYLLGQKDGLLGEVEDLCVGVQKLRRSR